MDFTPPIHGGSNLDPGANFSRDRLQGFTQSKTQCTAADSVKCATHRWGRLGQWNLAGQKLDLLDVAGRDLDIVFVQEVARDEMGWKTSNTDLFHWVSHRGGNHYRGVAVGIATDKLDCVIQKVCSSRAIWILARIKVVGRIVLGTMHCHTGATNAIYQAAFHDFTQSCPRKWRQYPVACGLDLNEELTCFEHSDLGSALASGSSNLNEVAHQFLQLGIKPVAPNKAQWRTPTHYPRDASRIGRQIDAIWTRMIGTGDVCIDAERRHVVGTDHALVHTDLFVSSKFSNRWGNDSRPRYVCADLPPVVICDASDLARAARQCTCPRKGRSYCDSEEVKGLIAEARKSHDKQRWKQVHRLRRKDRREWEQQRLSMILHGDWHEYRALQKERKRRTGWWGEMLQERTSLENTCLVQEHLKGKLVNEYLHDWDELLQMQIDSISVQGEFVDFTKTEVREVLQHMKVNSAVGPDGIGVSFLRHAMSDEIVGPQLLDLINHIVRTMEMPTEWEKNFLALLAKCQVPSQPGDLRPICVSSVFRKLVTKLVCARSLPAMRTGSTISGCGKGRQAADVIGAISRIRDVVQEWKTPLLLCKLDISGAFDKLDRQRIVEFLKENLRHKELDHELKYLLGQLRTYRLCGVVPGGHEIQIDANVGIKQGAPESAELFGMIMDALLTRIISHPKWGEFGWTLKDLDAQLIFYQDDIFLVESDLTRLGRRIKVLERGLAQYGLRLAAGKTKIVASAAYRGPRNVQVGGSDFIVSGSSESVKVLGISFNLQESPSQQAKEILHRARVAAAAHFALLRGRASWHKKADMIRTLVESQFSWTGGALHWNTADLKQANTVQLQVLRSAFRILRLRGESWQEWNSRSMRMCRAWLAYNDRPRWSTSLLRLQHTLLGHWARRIEWPPGSAEPHMCLPMRALQWKSTAWWRWQQQLSRSSSERHPTRFYACNAERQLSDAHGNDWPVQARDRILWGQLRAVYIRMWDVKWTRERQLAIRY